MTGREAAAKRNERIRELVLERVPIKSIASMFGLHPNSVRAVIEKLVRSGQLVRIHDTSPAVYADPCARVTPKDGAREGTVPRGGYAGSGGVMDCLPPSGRLPQGWVNHHISGYVSFRVRKAGTFGDVPDPRIGFCGYWEAPRSGGNCQTLRMCRLRLFGQEPTVAFYVSTRGTMQFRVHPGRVYVDASKIGAQRSREILVERAEYIAGLLRATGWQVSDPEIRGVLHTARENDPLAKLIPADRNDRSDDIVVDSSPGVPETEMEGCEDDEAIAIYANIPSAVKEMREGVSANASSIGEMRGDLVALREVLGLQADAIAALAGNVTALAGVQARVAGIMAEDARAKVECAVRAFDGRGYV